MWFLWIEPYRTNSVFEGVPDVPPVVVQQERRLSRDAFRSRDAGCRRWGRCGGGFYRLLRIGRRCPDARIGSVFRSLRDCLGSVVVFFPSGLEFLDGACHVGLLPLGAPRSVVPPGSIPSPYRDTMGSVDNVSHAHDTNRLECFDVNALADTG